MESEKYQNENLSKFVSWFPLVISALADFFDRQQEKSYLVLL